MKASVKSKTLGVKSLPRGLYFEDRDERLQFIVDYFCSVTLKKFNKEEWKRLRETFNRWFSGGGLSIWPGVAYGKGHLPISQISQTDFKKIAKRIQKQVRLQIDEYLNPLSGGGGGVAINNLKLGTAHIFNSVVNPPMEIRKQSGLTYAKSRYCPSGSFEDLFLLNVWLSLPQPVNEIGEKIRRCPEEKCGHKMFYRKGKKKFCSDNCTNRAMQRAFYKRNFQKEVTRR